MSNNILQLNPPIPLDTPLGKGLAHFLVDYGTEHHWLWVCFMDETGECWTFENTKIRAQHNPTFGRNLDKIHTQKSSEEATRHFPKKNK
jgi:hypothetical protein